MTHQTNTSPASKGSAVHGETSIADDRARLLVHEDAVACLVAADAVAKTAPETVLEQVRMILQDATARIEEAATAGQSGAVVVKLSAKRQAEYFPKETFTEPTAVETKEVESYWNQAIEHQPRFRNEALAQIGPLLPPRDVAERLGVTRATVANWRSQGKLLGVRFDNHEFLFPSWQFVSSPTEGERGVLRHLDDVVAALGDAHPWDKALFFLTRLPALGDHRPLDVLHSGSASAVDLVIQLARQRGELGS